MEINLLPSYLVLPIYYINSFRLDEKYTDTVLKFSDGHIYVHWMILEAHGMVQSGGPLPETLIVIILLR